jgi:hypothetical protein
MLPEYAKRVASAEFMVHKCRGSKFYKAMKDCTEACQKDECVLGLCFDYMQNLPLPKIPVQDVFYLRQLWVNVFCVHNMKTRKYVMYVYHEGTARKGPNEVCSFLHDYMKQNVPACVCDRNFELVKRVQRRVDRVYSVKEYVEFIVNAAKRNRFSVKLIST